MVLEPRIAIPGSPEDEISVCGPSQLAQLQKIPLFDGLSTEGAEKLCQLFVSRGYAARRRLFETGDQGDAMYLIESGRVRISVTDADGREVMLADLAEGEFFGEMALIDGNPRSAGATIVEDARLAVLTRADFLSFVTSDPQIALGMLAAMAGRLRRTDHLLRHRISRNANAEDAAHTTRADRAADLIATFGGSWKFIGFSIALFFVWMGVNTWMLNQNAFDPYPYVFLNLVLAMITGLQAPIIMMSQNRQSQKDRLRSDLDYEVNLKNELLLTEIRNLMQEQRKPREESADFSRS